MSFNPKTVNQVFIKRKKLHEGGDGKVYLFSDRKTKTEHIIGKVPIHGTAVNKTDLLNEIKILRGFDCDQIVKLLGYDEHWLPFGPALFFEFCELGDAFDFTRNFRRLRKDIPEETIWKFYADVTKGLNHIQSMDTVPLIHGDLKPENILVARPHGCHDQYPTLPHFKIGDFTRTLKYEPGRMPNYRGTWEYAPPKGEQLGVNVSPASDIWALGASIQFFAFGIPPVESDAKFMKTYKEQTGIDIIASRVAFNPNSEEYRRHRQVVYRPLNATPKEQMEAWDWPNTLNKPPQYSDSLNRWYALCMERDFSKRVTAANLLKYLVPVAEHKIRVITAKRKVEAASAALICRTMPRVTSQTSRVANCRTPDIVPAPTCNPNPLSFENGPEILEVLDRRDFGMPARKARELMKRPPSIDSAERQQREQRYLRGMKKKK